jgi:hypothetical protein
MSFNVTFEFPQCDAFVQAMAEAPAELHRGMVSAFREIGKGDSQAMREQVASRFNVHRKGFVNSFKAKVDSTETATGDGGASLREYTGAKPFRIFETGGTVQASRSRSLLILTSGAGRSDSGKRRFSKLEIARLLDSGEAKIIVIRGRPAIVKLAQKTKTGKFRRGAKDEIIAFLQPSIQEKKRIDFFKNFDGRESIHNDILEKAAESALASVEKKP